MTITSEKYQKIANKRIISDKLFSINEVLGVFRSKKVIDKGDIKNAFKKHVNL